MVTSQVQAVSKRKLKKVRDQLEFYFSSSNLSKDKFLQQHMSPPINPLSTAGTSCGYVALSVVGQFSVMKELSGGNIEVIRRGAELSSHLDLSEDKMSVKRRLPAVQLTEEEATLRTIYVEHVPPILSSHALLKKFFSKYGSVTYVSIPDYKIKVIKRKTGKVTVSSNLFSFIEFSCHQAAVTAIEAFNGSNPVDNILNNKPSMLQLSLASQSLVNFGKDLTNKSNTSQTNRKRRFEVENEIDSTHNMKRKKIETSPPLTPLSNPTMEVTKTENIIRVVKGKLTNRRRPRRKKRRNKHLPPTASNTVSTIKQMCVMSKSDWLKKKSEFKTAEKSFMTNLKALNKQVASGVVMRSNEVTCDKEYTTKSTEKERSKRGCDKIVSESMRIADQVFKWK